MNAIRNAKIKQKKQEQMKKRELYLKQKVRNLFPARCGCEMKALCASGRRGGDAAEEGKEKPETALRDRRKAGAAAEEAEARVKEKLCAVPVVGVCICKSPLISRYRHKQKREREREESE